MIGGGRSLSRRVARRACPDSMRTSSGSRSAGTMRATSRPRSVTSTTAPSLTLRTTLDACCCSARTPTLSTMCVNVAHSAGRECSLDRLGRAAGHGRWDGAPRFDRRSRAVPLPIPGAFTRTRSGEVDANGVDTNPPSGGFVVRPRSTQWLAIAGAAALAVPAVAGNRRCLDQRPNRTEHGHRPLRPARRRRRIDHFPAHRR